VKYRALTVQQLLSGAMGKIIEEEKEEIQFLPLENINAYFRKKGHQHLQSNTYEYR
jgi:hypothetical protein